MPWLCLRVLYCARARIVGLRVCEFDFAALKVHTDVCATQGKLFISFDVEFPKNGAIDGDASALLVKVSCPPSYTRACVVCSRRAECTTLQWWFKCSADMVDHILLFVCAYAQTLWRG